MADEYIQLGQSLEDIGVSHRMYAAYLFDRAKVLIEESGNTEALEILRQLAKPADVASRIDKYAEKCEYASSEDPRYYCNYVFLLFLKINDYVERPSDLTFQQLCDEYSSLVEGIDGEPESDIDEIYSHFKSQSETNSTFRGFMSKII